MRFPFIGVFFLVLVSMLFLVPSWLGGKTSGFKVRRPLFV